MTSPNDIKQSIRKLTVESSDQIHDRILDKLVRKLDTFKKQTDADQPYILRVIALNRMGQLVILCLIIALCLTCLVLSKRVSELQNKLKQAQQNTTLPGPDSSTAINLYLREHRNITIKATHASRSMSLPTSTYVDRHDILYYEFMDDPYEFGHPGIIVRGSSIPQQVTASESPVISNGQSLPLAEARKMANFDLVSPPQLHPGYMLDQIRRIDGRNALHLLYTDGINTVSLFEQPVDGQGRLGPQDFREYAVYCNKGQTGGTILAWRDDKLSYVLIGHAEMSQLMEMAQSIIATE
ncbi:hypothetical protein ACFL6U_09800 [Planctomycetota bacterium]